ncbi:MAG: NrdJb [Proteobacteria bacterium]|nr:NrdJb [Pseudomonadota bacterium]
MSKVKIDKKIVGYSVRQAGGKSAAAPRPEFRRETTAGGAEIIRMHEKLERPEMLIGSTYKVKTPVSDHAMYITINDIVLNEGTEYEKRRPFEIFINSKNLDHYQWIVALTRIISAVFRKGGDVTFLVDELKAVFDPRGGYWKPGGKYMPSIIAELGYIVEKHLILIGLLKKVELDDEQKKLLEEKRAEYEARSKQQDAFSKSEYPEGAQLCTKCSTAAVVMMDGCRTCLSCGDSKCG